MRYNYQFKSVSDDELLRRLVELLSTSRRVESELVAHISEVDRRKLYLGQACSSMFVYATERLHLSEAEAYLRIKVARASRKYPMLLDMLSDGRLHLSAIAKIAPHLTDENRDEVLKRATGKTKREIEELVAELEPKPDVEAKVRKLPERRVKTRPMSPGQLCPDAVPSRPALAVVKPLAPSRYLFKFTARKELRDKLEKLRELMRSAVPDGDLSALIEDAVTEKIERLEAKRYGKTKSPRKNLEGTDTSSRSRHIPAAVKRAVRERDKNRCAFVDENGRRCSERNGLEFHHGDPFARGGDHRPENISLVCHAHNGYLAERDYGKKKMERHRRARSRVSEPPPVYICRFQAFVTQGVLRRDGQRTHIPLPVDPSRKQRSSL